MTHQKTSILVVEDDPSILKGLLDLLVFNGYEVKGISDGEEGLKEGLSQSYDLIILDVMLPTIDGFTICSKIRKNKINQPIVMLTAKGSKEDIVSGFHSGADDYISKPFSIRELMVRIEAVLRRSGKSIGTEKIRHAGVLFDAGQLKACFEKKSVALTRKEMDIILYLHKFKDRIISKKELLTQVWHYVDGDIETRTVDIHMLKLRKKLSELAGDKIFLETVRGEGYRFTKKIPESSKNGSLK